MNDTLRKYHDTLMHGIEACEKNNTDYKKHIECCFHLAENICREIELFIAEKGFNSSRDEMLFYKTIKPKFTSLVEFYSLVYSAEIFAPDSKTEKLEFWQAEKARAKQFIEANRNFADYLYNQETFNDEEYFLRSSPKSEAYEKLTAKLFARQLYIDLLEKKPAI